MFALLKVIFAFVVVFGLYACETDEPSLASLEVDQESIDRDFLIGDFEINDIRLVLVNDDGSEEIIQLEESMILEDDLDLLKEPGVHEITVTYQDLSTTFTLQLVAEYVVKFLDYDGTELLVKNVLYGEDVTPPEEPIKEGYSFTGWSKAYTDITNDMEIYAEYQINVYTVTFLDTDESVLKEINVEHGNDAVPPEAPTKEGHTFIGWSKNYFEISSDMEIYAQYEINVYTVTFLDANETVLKELIVEHGDDVTPPKEPIKEGYTFTGWSKSYSEISSDMEIYAEYEINVYTVVFFDTDNTVLKEMTVEHGDDAISPEEPTKEGHTFTGWSVSYTEITEDLEIYAEYEINVYTVTFLDMDDAILKEMTVEHGDDVTPPEEPSQEGHTFIGWSKAYSEITEDLEIYAEYEINVYTVTFLDMDDVILSEMTVEHGDDVTPPEEPSQEGHTFIGWSKAYSEITEDLEIRAEYQVNSYEITYNILPDTILLPRESITTIAAGYSRSAVLTSEGRFFTWGLNNYYQLGDGTREHRISPINITHHLDLNAEEKIVDIALGTYMHTAALTSKGRLFMWGINSSGQGGIGTTTSPEIIVTPKDITDYFNLETNEYITDMALGDRHTIVVTSENRVFTFGSNSSGQLGDGTTTDRYQPTEITVYFNFAVGEEIIQIGASNRNTSLLTSEGRLFMWGENDRGQIGDGNRGVFNNRDKPTEITEQLTLEDDETIIRFALGSKFASALTSEGRMFTWGTNYAGQLGDGEGDIDEWWGSSYRDVPFDITDNFNLSFHETIIDIAMGGSHTAALTSEGRLFTFGVNTFGQLGDGNVSKTELNDRDLPYDITAAFDFTEESVAEFELGNSHNIIISSEGNLYAWGYNQWGNLGLGFESPEEVTPQFIDLRGDFISDDYEVVKEIFYDYQEQFELLAPNKDGYIFDGWYLDEALTEPYAYGDTMVAKDLILYGRWVLPE